MFIFWGGLRCKPKGSLQSPWTKKPLVCYGGFAMIAATYHHKSLWQVAWSSLICPVTNIWLSKLSCVLPLNIILYVSSCIILWRRHFKNTVCQNFTWGKQRKEMWRAISTTCWIIAVRLPHFKVNSEQHLTIPSTGHIAPRTTNKRASGRGERIRPEMVFAANLNL